MNIGSNRNINVTLDNSVDQSLIIRNLIDVIILQIDDLKLIYRLIICNKELIISTNKNQIILKHICLLLQINFIVLIDNIKVLNIRSERDINNYAHINIFGKKNIFLHILTEILLLEKKLLTIEQRREYLNTKFNLEYFRNYLELDYELFFNYEYNEICRKKKLGLLLSNYEYINNIINNNNNHDLDLKKLSEFIKFIFSFKKALRDFEINIIGTFDFSKLHLFENIQI